MAWYRTGTVTVNNNSATVTGVGTLFVDNGTLNPGDIFFAPDAKDYEIASIQSNTQLTLVTPYLGANAAGASYAIAPIGLLPSALALQVKSTLALASQASAAAILSTPAQGLTAAQQANARANIGAMAAGPIDSTPIGATTPSTGAFTTLSASGASTVAALTASGLITASAGLTSTAGTTNLGTTNTAGLTTTGVSSGAADLVAAFYKAATNGNGSSFVRVGSVSAANALELETNSGAGAGYRFGTIYDSIISNSYTGSSAWGNLLFASGGIVRMSIQGGTGAGAGLVSTVQPMKISAGYTVATLPAGAAGQQAFVTDAVSPSYLGSLTGGGSTRCAVFHNGAAWVSC